MKTDTVYTILADSLMPAIILKDMPKQQIFKPCSEIKCYSLILLLK